MKKTNNQLKNKKNETGTDPQATKAAATHALEQIQNGLPDGYTATNKRAVMKTPNPNPHGEPPAWTSWAQDKDGNRFLALLKVGGSVKMIPENKANFKNV